MESCREWYNSCLICQRNRNMPAKVPIRTWEWPEKPWTRLHVDHAGPVEGKTIFNVDAHSKWIDAHVVPSTSATFINCAFYSQCIWFTTNYCLIQWVSIHINRVPVIFCLRMVLSMYGRPHITLIQMGWPSGLFRR